MLLTKLYRNVFRTSLHQCNLFTSAKCAKTILNCQDQSRKKLLRTLTPSLSQHKNYMQDSQNDVIMPALNDECPLLVWPAFFKTLNIFFQWNIMMKPRLDPEFDMNEFLEGSKHAMSIVSNALANEDYESIKDLVTPEVIQNLKTKISTFSSEQKQLIRINKEDVYVAFPYEVGIMFDDDKADQKFVEIMVVFHSLRGLKRMRDEGNEPPLNMGMIPEYQRLIFVCNYRFIREYTKGVDSSWTINMLNHFMPAATP